MQINLWEIVKNLLPILWKLWSFRAFLFVIVI